MEIKASSKYNWETIKKFNRFHNFKRGKFKIVCNVLLVLCTIIILADTVISLIFNTFSGDTLSRLLIWIFVTIMLIFVYFIMPKVAFKKNKVGKNSENLFTFREDTFEIEGSNGNYNGKSEIKYSVLHKIYETREFLYIYINFNQAYIVDKKTISDEALLRELLVSKIGNKKYIYKIR